MSNSINVTFDIRTMTFTVTNCQLLHTNSDYTFKLYEDILAPLGIVSATGSTGSSDTGPYRSSGSSVSSATGPSGSSATGPSGVSATGPSGSSGSSATGQSGSSGYIGTGSCPCIPCSVTKSPLPLSNVVRENYMSHESNTSRLGSSPNEASSDIVWMNKAPSGYVYVLAPVV